MKESLVVEIYRILLKHPYCRQPNARPKIKAMAGDCVISSYYKVKGVKLLSPSDLSLPHRKSFEFYANNIINDSVDQSIGGDDYNADSAKLYITNNNGDEPSHGTDAVDLWETNELMAGGHRKLNQEHNKEQSMGQYVSIVQRVPYCRQPIED